MRLPEAFSWGIIPCSSVLVFVFKYSALKVLFVWCGGLPGLLNFSLFGNDISVLYCLKLIFVQTLFHILQLASSQIKYIIPNKTTKIPCFCLVIRID